VYGLDLISRTDGEGNQEYYLTDGLGSTSDLRDESGDAIADYTYDVFGAIRDQSGSSPNEFTFTGEQVDADSGLYFLRARYYDPATGRFLTQDPLWGSLGNPQTQNRYPYVGNNPVRFVDPYGLDLCETVGGLFGKKKDCKEVGEGIKQGAEAVGGAIQQGAEAVGEFLSDPENVASVVQGVAGVTMYISCGSAALLPSAAVCGVSIVAYGAASVAKVYFVDSTHERVIAGVTGFIGAIPASGFAGKLLAASSGALDALASPSPAYSADAYSKE